MKIFIGYFMRIKQFQRECMSLLVLLALLCSQVAFGAISQERMIFKKLFTNWTTAFNHRELAKSCNLFSVHVVADYRGISRKNYTSICNGFKKIFADDIRKYHYSFKLHEIYQSEFLAAVRITWYLKITNKNGRVTHVQDEGLDILEKNSKGEWKIINYLSYPTGNSEE
ncbi:hypothetical protein [Legionella feeleii]|uniref:DUF4440 domain-containing protein n=1 Tax=Legionella feeleii TaxID=453 RepID=A0A0W0UA48_9GAMM|nr:hypothetical protein [Legionella feeleii]KTD04657.1 hypothetical protein Lfee_0115 [Legionella feeleii]SPX59492.1 Uncharacterised protein [Legionella feeleii]